MATLVCFHAHPDDECIATGGTMAIAAADGHRVVLIVATRGEHGEVDDGFLDDGEHLMDRRVRETHAAAAILGVQRVEFLGYVDSGMIGTPENEEAGSFWTADVEEAAAKVAAILDEEGADVFTCYDEIGGYGHPDHIQVHRVGMRAAELAKTPHVFQATINRDHFLRLMEAVRAGEGPDLGVDPPEVTDDEGFGMSESVITACVDVSSVIDLKRQSMRAHASQIGEQSFFLAMPDEAFLAAFGFEWYIGPRHAEGISGTDVFDALGRA